MNKEHLVAAESISIGHPDYLADCISDSIYQAYYSQDPDAHVACETLVTTNFVLVAGEIKSSAEVDVESVIRDTIKNVGYTDPDQGFSYDTVEILNKLHEQSADIDMGVTKENVEDQGSGDQGFMVGFASNETKDFMPLPIALAKALTNKLTAVRESGEAKLLLPDGKSQVVLDYSSDKPQLKTVLISNHHKDVDMSEVKDEILNLVIKPVISDYGFTLDDVEILINPTGRFVIGGPNGDTGLTGRKLVVENYGPSAPIGGGCSAGKDWSKTDRSGAYAARYVAKNIVAAGLADVCEVQISYAIGVAEPTSIYVDTRGTSKTEKDLTEIVRNHFDLRPYAICKWIKSQEVDINKLRKFGAYGNDYLPWERCDKVAELKQYL